MSNFICSECGMTNIDCDGAGYKTPKEIELEKENKLLKEQLKEANKTIRKAQELCPDKNVMLMCNPARPSFGMMTNDVLNKYLEKWGIK